MRLTILQADHVLDEFQPKFGDYDQMFESILARSLGEGAPGIAIDCVDVTVGVPMTVVSDVYLITGSRHSVYDDLPWMPGLVEFLHKVLDAGKKIIGVCFGHQLMAHHFGGHVEPAKGGWAVGVHRSQVTRHEGWMTPGVNEFALLSSHKDQVSRLPPGGEIYASSDFCPIAGFTWNNQVVTIQGHPEFTKEYSESLMTFRRELLGEALYVNGVESLGETTDGIQVMRWLLNYVAANEAGIVNEI